MITGFNALKYKITGSSEKQDYLFRFLIIDATANNKVVIPS